MTSDHSILIQGLNKSYSLGKSKIRAIQELNLSLPKPCIATLMGPSGSGKSTLLNILASIDQADSGTVSVFGKDLTAASSKEVHEYRRKTVGIIFQFFNLLPYLTAWENVALPLFIQGIPKSHAEKLSLDALGLVGLSERRSHKPKELSGGEQQRVAIARAIVHEPKLILADEPTGNLDTKNSEKITEILWNLKKERNLSLLVVTHNPEIGALGEIQIQMRDGTILG
jgi:putative ABC transport system ATP-binding protein/lipoprotein-releasing system ATP-binding protein